jgi:hypothetical protein
MFLLYHSEGCNICETEFHKCYVNDLRTTTCSGMLGLRMRSDPWAEGCGAWWHRPRPRVLALDMAGTATERGGRHQWSGGASGEQL